MRRCAHCGVTLERGTTGRPGRFCSTVCRQRAWRRRHAGVLEVAYVDGAMRGPTRLERLTRRERAAEILSERPSL